MRDWVLDKVIGRLLGWRFKCVMKVDWVSMNVGGVWCRGGEEWIFIGDAMKRTQSAGYVTTAMTKSIPEPED